MVPSRRVLLALLCFCPALAAAGGGGFVAGRIAAAGGGALAVTDEGGVSTMLALAPDVPVTALVRHTAEEIVPGGSVCAVTVVAPDGPPMAMEVQIFPGGVPDPAHPPCAALGGSARVAGVVERTVRGAGHLAMRVAQGGETTLVMVAPETPVVTYEPGDAGLLVPGAPVLAFGTRADDGGMTVDRITVGVGGAVPAW
jgi:hypothetical protein